VSRQPVTQHDELGRRGPKRLYVLHGLPVSATNPDARGNRRFMNVEPAAALQLSIHRPPPQSRMNRRPKEPC